MQAVIFFAFFLLVDLFGLADFVIFLGNGDNTPAVIECRLRLSALLQLYILGGFIEGILRGVRCTKL